ncbi:formate dehydrogenase accessory sulfurtransferase FdhD [Chitinimonas sp.]|uniref:formate dehydrogenase accessory sulfurtransferase FdhD n=1 Tax=Chitinimonas sp. TaxID=1934313 RepID=UPI0035B041D9
MPAGLSGLQRHPALRLDGGNASPREEWLAEEVAIALSYNGIAHAVMMASPLDLEDFALGFSLSEGLIQQAGELLDFEVEASALGLTLALRIPEARFQALKQQRRNLSGKTGCGLCGLESLAAARRPAPQVPAGPLVDPAAIHAALQAMQAQQPLNAASGAVHAAAYWHDGQLTVREDVGRHNALDKLIGALARTRAPRDGLTVISSRASYEMVHKAACAGLPLLAAISAPTALAVDLAEQSGITLIGFARETRMTVYSHGERLHRPA